MNPYEVLEISPGASPEEIKSAYHRMAKQWHPDRFTGEAKVDAERRFRMLAEAFSMLRNVARPEPPAAPPAPVPAPPPPIAQAPASPQIQLDNSSGDRPAQKTAEDWFRDAREAFEAKAAGRALALIQYALRLDPERGEFHALHGKILDATGNDNRAKIKALETAIKHNPKDVDSLIMLAQSFQSLGMQARATRLWGTVRNLAPNHAIFNAPGKKSPKAKEQLQGLGEQVNALVEEAKAALGKIFKRG